MTSAGTVGTGHRIPSFDGVRAIAIGAVLAIHTGLPFTGGGSVGVDMFFVLSGFLITGLLITEFERSGSVRFRAFYRRRLLRLMPALCVMVVVGVLLSRLLDDPELPERQSGIGGVLALTYTTNPAVAYFGFDDNPFLHTWSLGVEEYYYLAWPPLLYWGLRRGWSRLQFARYLVVPLVAFSAYRVVYWFAVGGDDHLRYGFDMRSDQLLIGSMVGLVAPALTATLAHHRRRISAGAWAGLAFLVAMITFAPPLTYSATLGYPLVALATAVLVLHLATDRGSVLTRLLSRRPLVYVGRISYSLYLWGFLMGHAFPASIGGLPDKVVSVVQYAVLLLVAAASYHLVELPIQRWGSRRSGRVSPVGTDGPPTQHRAPDDR